MVAAQTSRRTEFLISAVEVFREFASDPSSRSLDGIAGEMSVPLRRGCLRMTEQLAYDKQRVAVDGADGGECVAQIMQPHVRQPSRIPDCPPWLLKIY